MSDLELRRSHQLSEQQLQQIASAIGEKLTARHGGQCQWSERAMHYELPGTAAAEVSWDADSICVSIRLGALAALLKPLVVGEVERQLDRYLG